jgi:dTDP-4-dehydrorhamnose 3,5-epimerase
MSARLELLDTPLADVKIVQRKALRDDRGSFERVFCALDLASVWGDRQVRAANRTVTVKRGTVRGLHYQRPPHAEMKLVTCVRGEVFDVAVDLRQDSPSLLRWHGEVLSAENGRALLIPEGFAHGLQALTDDVEMLYFHTASYVPSADSGISPGDPRVAIRWPLPVGMLSARDAAHPPIPEDFAGIAL